VSNHLTSLTQRLLASKLTSKTNHLKNALLRDYTCWGNSSPDKRFIVPSSAVAALSFVVRVGRNVDTHEGVINGLLQFVSAS
jgi:hypothetical protein